LPEGNQEFARQGHNANATDAAAAFGKAFAIPATQLAVGLVAQPGPRYLDGHARMGRLPMVILVDALDESEDIGLFPGANPLYLPQTLLDGGFFIITTREQADDRLVVDQRKDIYIRDDDPRNLEDVRQFIQNYVIEHQAQMAARIQQWGVVEDEFVAQGLHDYYQRHWRAMKALNVIRFEKYNQPVVCILATVREPVTVEQVAEWTGLTTLSVKEVIAEWREFRNADEYIDGELLYRVYHTSFQDFLRDEVGLMQYHEKIAQTALDKIKW